MERTEVMQELTQIFRGVFFDDDILLSEDTSADDIEDWDSIMHVTLIENIEKHFNIKFTLKEVIGLKSVGDTIDIIMSKQNE